MTTLVINPVLSLSNDLGKQVVSATKFGLELSSGYKVQKVTLTPGDTLVVTPTEFIYIATNGIFNLTLTSGITNLTSEHNLAFLAISSFDSVTIENPAVATNNLAISVFHQ